MTSLWLIYKSYESCMYIYIWNYLSTCWFMLKDDDAKWCYGSLAFLACEYTYIIHLYVRIAYRFHRWPAVLPWLFHIVPQKAKRKVQVCESIHVNFRIVFMSMGPSRNGFVFFTKKCWSSFHGSMFGHASKTRMGICYHIHITWQWSSSLALSMIYIYICIYIANGSILLGFFLPSLPRPKFESPTPQERVEHNPKRFFLSLVTLNLEKVRVNWEYKFKVSAK